MNVPIQITFRHGPHSPRVEAIAREQLQHLAGLCDRIQACRVVIDSPQHRHRHGNPFEALVEVLLPGEELVAHDIIAGPGPESCMEQALHGAFDKVRHQLKTKQGKQSRRSIRRREPVDHERAEQERAEQEET